nr:YggS family pyridoxal phosphate-dependent enzyme [Yimella sp. cx-51]
MSVQRTGELSSRLEQVRERIARAAEAAQRDAQSVQLVVVTKFFPVDDLRRLIELGVTDIAENKDQEAGAKIAELTEDERARVTAHFVGQLQSNKAGHVASYADVVQSIDRAKIVRALANGAQRHGRTLEVMLQVDLDGSQAGRGGAAPDQIEELAELVTASPHLNLRGLMAVAPRDADPDDAFERLAGLSQALRVDHPSATSMSAGMSGDLETAIRHGATHVRIGTAVLGARPTA